MGGYWRAWVLVFRSISNRQRLGDDWRDMGELWGLWFHNAVGICAEPCMCGCMTTTPHSSVVQYMDSTVAENTARVHASAQCVWRPAIGTYFPPFDHLWRLSSGDAKSSSRLFVRLCHTRMHNLALQFGPGSHMTRMAKLPRIWLLGEPMSEPLGLSDGEPEPAPWPAHNSNQVREGKLLD